MQGGSGGGKWCRGDTLLLLIKHVGVLGLGVLILAIPRYREVKFAFFLLWRIKWHLWTHAHVYACFLCTHTQTPPVFSLAEPKGVSLFLHIFLFHNGGFPVHI